MKFISHGTDAAPSDGLLTSMAEGPLALVIVQLTEGTSIQFKEGASRKSAEAILKVERRDKECGWEELLLCFPLSQFSAFKFLLVKCPLQESPWMPAKWNQSSGC